MPSPVVPHARSPSMPPAERNATRGANAASSSASPPSVSGVTTAAIAPRNMPTTLECGLRPLLEGTVRAEGVLGVAANDRVVEDPAPGGRQHDPVAAIPRVHEQPVDRRLPDDRPVIRRHRVLPRLQQPLRRAALHTSRQNGVTRATLVGEAGSSSSNANR